MSAGSAVARVPWPVREDACNLHVLTDDELLARFFQSRDEAAFVVLVRRYGPLVYGVCRRVLRNANDAEDAFQATFLVLVRKGRTLCNPGRLGSWLYGVAYRTARKAKAKAAQRSKSEREASAMLPRGELGEMTYQEMSDILDEEIGQLPEKYAAPLVLCYLHGKTNAQAASQLGWPEGSMSRRLCRAREMLRVRLTRRGLTWSVLLMAAVFSQPAAGKVPPLLVVSTARAASVVAQGVTVEEAVSRAVAELVHDSLLGMTAGRLALSAILAAASVLLALVVIVRQVGVPANAAMPRRGEAEQTVAAQASCSHAAPAQESAAPATAATCTLP